MNNKLDAVHGDKELEEKICALTHWVPNHQLDPKDVFIVGYMKSGTTWFRNLVAGVIYGVTSEQTPYSVVWELVPNHGPNKPYYKRYSTPMYFRSHDFPQPYYKRVVYLLRDGRDVVVSLKHHLQSVYGQDVDLLKLAKGRNPRFGGKFAWYEHVEAWLSNPCRAQMLIVKYEDLKKDSISELRRFCEFAGVKRDDAFLEHVAASASFEKMRDKEARLGFGRPRWSKDKRFMRKGQIGSHKEEIPPEVLEFFMHEAGDTLRKAGYL